MGEKRKVINWANKKGRFVTTYFLPIGKDSGPDVGVTSFSNPLEFCLLFRALLSKELNLLNAGLTGAATCNSCEPEK